MKKLHKRLLALLLAAVVLASGVQALAEDADTLSIRTADDLVKLAESCALDTWSQGKTVELLADISLDGVDFAPIPTFGGVFLGNGHTISGLSLSGKYSHAGLFAEIQESGRVKNLTVSGTLNISGSCEAAGGIAGVNRGAIISCSFSGSVSGSVNTGAIAGQNSQTGSIQNCRTAGSVAGSRSTGGIAGSNLGLIANGVNASYVNTVSSDATFSVQDISVDVSFDLSKLSTQDTAVAATDTGGIAGYSSGILRSCSNEGVVGYPHVGYNVGGVAGRSCGYVASCSNRGEVYGRKDVGGIIGQMEPYLELNVENSTLAKMEQQLLELSDLIDKTADDAQGGAGGISSRLNKMSGYVGNAINEAGDISVSIGGSGQIDGEANGDAGLNVDVSIPPLDVDIDGSHSENGSVSGSVEIIATPDLSGLTAAINGIGSQLSLLNGAVSGAAGTVADDIRAINEKFNELSETMFDAIFTIGSADGDILSDTSAVDIELVRLGKVTGCQNDADVSGDINIGGIAGTMAIEYEYDPEDDIASNLSAEYKREYEMKAILTSCENTGSVDARRSCAGGVAGRQDLGIITSCRGFGDVTSESGSYSGGVVGLTSATVRSCWAKCTVSGAKYTGGIVGSGVSEALTGSGSTVAGCVSMVDIRDAQQYYGAVSGADAGEYLENLFVSDTLAGIDGRSYSGRAEPVSYNDMLALDGVPDAMKTFSLRFVADDVTVSSLRFAYGDSFGEDTFPEIPEKDGCYAEWDTTELSDLHFDTVVTAVYHTNVTAVASAETRDDGRAVLFAEGSFDDTALVHATAEDASGEALLDSLEVSSQALPWYARLFSPVHGGIVEQRHITLPDDGAAAHTVHYLPPEIRIGELDMYVLRSGSWERIDTEAFGSYVSFDIDGTEADIAAVSIIPARWIWCAGGALLLICILILVIALNGHRKRKAKRAAAKAAEAPEGEAEPAAAEKKPRKKGHFLLLLLPLLAALAAAGVLLVPRVCERIAPYRALDALTRETVLSMNVSVSASHDGDTETLNVPVAVKTVDSRRIARTEIEGVPLYFSENKLILENGTAYSLGDTLPDYAQLLPDIAALCREAEFSADGEHETVELTGSDAAMLLTYLAPETAQRASVTDDARVSLTLSDGAVKSLSVSAAGQLTDGAPFTLDAVIDGITASADFEIPEAVSRAAAKGSTGDLTEVTGDLINVISAWHELQNRESAAAELTVSAHGGPLVLRTAFDLAAWQSGDGRVHGVGKSGLWLYTDGTTVVTASGKRLSSGDMLTESAAKLPEALYLACLNGDVTAAKHADGSAVYTLMLSGSDAAELAELLAPDMGSLDSSFAYGTAKLTVSNGKIVSLALSCTGTVKVAFTEAPLTVSAEIALGDESAGELPGAVTDALDI